MNKYADKAPSLRAKHAAIAERTRGSASMCMRKTTFADQAKAEKRAAAITATGTPMRAYKCPHCYDYHLTSKAAR